ncbi:MAG: hypothetical protein ACLQHM_14750 [Limisphaerales bacterium]
MTGKSGMKHGFFEPNPVIGFKKLWKRFSFVIFHIADGKPFSANRITFPRFGGPVLAVAPGSAGAFVCGFHPGSAAGHAVGA